MRAPAVLLFSFAVAATSGKSAVADTPTPTPRIVLVDALRDGAQALVFDRITGDYAVVKVGDVLQGFRVAEIDGEQLVLSAGTTPERLFVLPRVERAALGALTKTSPTATGPVLAAPTAPVAAAPAVPVPAVPALPAPVLPAEPVIAPAEPAISTPVGSPAPSPVPVVTVPGADTAAPSAGSSGPADLDPADVLDPYGADSAVLDPYPEPVTEQAIPSVTVPVAEPMAPPAAAPAPQPPVEPQSEQRTLSRNDLDRALSDFAALARDVAIERVEGGGIRIVHLARGSFAERVGLRKGDLVHRVAGRPIDTVDDAAAAYARVMSAKAVVVELERRGARFELRYQLTD